MVRGDVTQGCNPGLENVLGHTVTAGRWISPWPGPQDVVHV